jgi:hypothetical protein
VHDIKKGIQLSEQFAFDLTSSDSSVISIPELYGKNFLIAIENDDNESLKINSVEAFQATHYLVSYLEKNNDYTLFVGNSKADLPLYDLVSFRDNIPAMLPEIKTKQFEQVKKQHVREEENRKWFKSKLWIWSALAFVMVLLGLISYRMIKDMERKDN